MKTMGLGQLVLVSPRELVVPLPATLSPGPLKLPALEALGLCSIITTSLL